MNTNRKYGKTYRISMPNIKVKGKFMLNPKEEKLLLGGKVYVTEKMDGANSGIYKSNGETFLQKRGGNIDGSHPQYKFFEQWGYNNFEKIKAIPDNMVVYGELMRCVHTIYYDRLPDWFLVFAMFDLTKGRFLKLSDVSEISRRCGLCTVPVLYEGKTDKEHLETLLRTESMFGEVSEGIVVQNIRQQIRGKIVKEEFIKSIEDSECHWSRTNPSFNKLVNCDNDCKLPQTPNYCYMCGSPMDEDVSAEQEENEYYTEDDAADLVYDMEQLREYIYGLDDAIVDGMYKKEYVDTYNFLYSVPCHR